MKTYPKILDVESKNSKRLLVTFNNGIKKIYDCKPLLDDEVFKPSNLDSEKIIIYIENAILDIENNAPLPKEQKEELIEYLYKTKTELAEKRTSWNKVVGGLVIVAALLSGISDTPQAYDNVNKAIHYILGTSVEKHIPPSLPSLNHNRIEGYDKNDTPEGDKYA